MDIDSATIRAWIGVGDNGMQRHLPAARLDEAAEACRLRYCVEPPRTRRQIAAELGLTTEQARQAEALGLRYLRSAARRLDRHRQIEGSRLWAAIFGERLTP